MKNVEKLTEGLNKSESLDFVVDYLYKFTHSTISSCQDCPVFNTCISSGLSCTDTLLKWLKEEVNE